MAAIHIAGIAVDVAIGTAAAAVAPVVVTGAVVGAIGYLVYNRKTKNDKRSSSDEKQPGAEDEDPSSCLGEDKKKVYIQKDTLEEILDRDGEEIYNKLLEKTLDSQGGVWSDKNFRVDLGWTCTKQPNVKANLQLNEEAERKIGKNVISKLPATAKKKPTHAKLLWGEINLKTPPDYEAWKQELLSRFVK